MLKRNESSYQFGAKSPSHPCAVGDQVRLKRPISTPNGQPVPAGKTGRVVELNEAGMESETIGVELDEVHFGLGPWGNVLLAAADDFDALEVTKRGAWPQAELEKPQRWRRTA